MTIHLDKKYVLHYDEIIGRRADDYASRCWELRGKKFISGCFNEHSSVIPVNIDRSDELKVGTAELVWEDRAVAILIVLTDEHAWARKVDKDNFDVAWKPGIAIVNKEWRGIEEPIECVVHARIYEITLVPRSIAYQTQSPVRLLEELA